MTTDARGGELGFENSSKLAGTWKYPSYDRESALPDHFYRKYCIEMSEVVSLAALRKHKSEELAKLAEEHFKHEYGHLELHDGPD